MLKKLRYMLTLIALALVSSASYATESVSDMSKDKSASMSMQSEKMQGNMMVEMQDMHNKMMNAKTPEEREKLMSEQMQTMNKSMEMMKTMPKCKDMKECHKMMEKQMGMMEMMMQMMKDCHMMKH